MDWPPETNVSEAENVIKEHRSPFGPLAGSIVVIFEKSGAVGEKFSYELREGDSAPLPRIRIRSLFGVEYAGFAVTAERQRRTTITRDVTMDVALHSVKLDIDIVYSIADPRTLATRRSTDPLRRVRDEAASLIAPQLARKEWSRVRTEFRNLEREVVSSIMPRLQTFAADYGILVQEIVLNHHLTESNFDDIARIEAAQKQELDDQLAHDRNLRQDNFDHIRKMKSVERSADGREAQATVDGFARYDAIADAAAQAAIKALEDAATAVHTPAELAQAVATIREAIEQMRNLTSGGPSRIQAGGNGAAALLASPSDGAGSVIFELFSETEQMSWPSRDVKQSLQGATLHLIAELMLPHATEATIAEYRERLSDARAAAALSIREADYFAKFIDTDRLRRSVA